MGYEVRDVDFKGLRKALFYFNAFVIGSAIVGYFLYHYWAVAGFEAQKGKTVARQMPADPNPLLQDNVAVKTDIMDMRQAEDKDLTGPPMQLKDGSYRIPIEAAKQLLVQSGGHLAEEKPSHPVVTGNVSATPAPTAPPLPAGSGTGGVQ